MIRELNAPLKNFTTEQTIYEEEGIAIYKIYELMKAAH